MGNARFRHINIRLLAILAIIAIMATAAYGFAAGNTFSDGAGSAGDGFGQVSGFAVSNVHYTMDESNPAYVTGVTFDLDSAATAAQVRFGSGASAPYTWSSTYTCDGVGTGSPYTSWTCTVSGSDQISVQSVTQLDVAATN